MRRSVKVVGRRTAAALAMTAFVAGSWLGTAGPAWAVGPADWPAFLGGPAHTSHTADPVITPANAPTLAQKWHFNIPYVSSPVVADGSVFIGSFAGWFYKIDAVKGLLQKKIFPASSPSAPAPPSDSPRPRPSPATRRPARTWSTSPPLTDTCMHLTR